MSGKKYLIIYTIHMEVNNESHYREIILDRPDIQALSQKKLDLIEDNKKLIKEYEEIEKKINKNNTEIQKVKDKAIPMIEEELKKHQLGEYEIFTQTEIEDGKLKVAVIDLVKEMENKVKEMKKKNEDSIIYPVSNSDSSQGGGENTPTV